jgi:spore coat polysaccharide biosynthesis protein SpsF
MLIDPSVRSIRQNSIHHLPQLLVSMGGSDPAGITLTVLAALEHVAIKMDIAVVIGPGFSHHKKLAFFLERAKRHYVFHYCVTDMFALMREADLALISFGHTAAEAAAMGLPALYMCLTPDHAESAEVYAAQGLGINFGVYHQVDPIVLSSTIEGLLQDSSLRRKMARNGLQVFDGYGARRVAGLIMERIAGSESKHQSHFLQ